MGLFGSILFATLWASWIWTSVSFPRLGKFPAIISSNNFSAPFSLSSPFGTPIMQMLVHLMVSHKSLKLSSLFSFFFFFALIRWVPLPCLWVYWSFLLFHLVCYWTPIVYFSVELLYFSALWFMFETFLYFLLIHLCWSSHCIHAFFSRVLWASLWPLLWILYQVNYLTLVP